MRRLLLLVPALFALLVAPPVALADPEPEVSDGEDAPDQWDRWLGLELIGGADTPYGVLGAAIRLAPHRNVVFDLGGGGGRDGARVAGGVAFTIPDREFAFQVRGGVAGGPLNWDSVIFDQSAAGGAGALRPIHRTWDFTAFLDLDIALEWRHPEGFGGRIFFGVENDLITRATMCTYNNGSSAANCDTGLGGHPIRVYAGISVGYTFDFFR